MSKKVVVIGLDGGTFKLLKPLVAEGLMPNLKKIIEQGSNAILESTMPPMTGTAWSTFATGKQPGKHGVFDFLLVNDSLDNFHITTSRDIQGKTLYELIDEYKQTPITINLPNSWPPRLANKQIVITCLLTQGNQWIYPDTLKQKYPNLNNYQLTPNESLRLKERKQQYTDEILELTANQLKCVKDIYSNEKWDFFFYLFSSTDWIQHASFDELTEQRAESPLRIYKQVDEALGWFMNNLPPDTNLLIMSDHGFKSFKKTFYFNKWLEQEGYLVTTSGSSNFKEQVTRRAKETEKIRSQKKKVNLGKTFFSILKYAPWLEKPLKKVYHKFVKKYLPINLKVDIGIDYAKTKVCFPKGSYMTNAYINDARKYKNGVIQNDEEYYKLRNEIVAKIKNIKDDQGNIVIPKVYTKEEIYGENAPAKCPDLFFELGDYWLDGQFSSAKLFEENIVSNKHEKDGIFLAYGPDIKLGQELNRKSIADIAPTVLHMLNIPLPTDLDGSVIQEIFKQPKNIVFQNEKEQLDNLLDDIKI